MSFGEHTSIIAQRGDDEYLLCSASLRVPEDSLNACGINWNDAETARKEYMDKYFSHVSEDLRRVLTTIATQHYCTNSVGFSWPSRSGVALIGDAAHLMTPFAGVGVNVGMTDALVLAREIIDVCAGRRTLGQATRAYEEEMVPRAARFAQKTLGGKKNHFSATGAQEFADMLREHHAVQKLAEGKA